MSKHDPLEFRRVTDRHDVEDAILEGPLDDVIDALQKLRAKYEKDALEIRIEVDYSYDSRYVILTVERWETDAERTQRLDALEKQRQRRERQKKAKITSAKTTLKAQPVDVRKALFEELSKEFS